MEDLPLEVITDIFSRLPVKSLLRFRSASKSWRCRIDSPHFISLHLDKSIQTNANANANANTNIIFGQDSDLYEVHFDDAVAKAVELNHPLMCYSNRIRVLGSCNGLLCICNVAEDIAFWNPSIRKHAILPYLSVPGRSDSDASFLLNRVYGFGYDCFAGDYKLVRISYLVDLHSSTFDSQVRLYSLRTNVWKSLPSMPYSLRCAPSMGVFVGGALHWVVSGKPGSVRPDSIIAFDVRFENFRDVPMPEMDGNFEIDVAPLGGCLCMLAKHLNTRVDVWSMKEYGSRETWCKLFSLTKSNVLRSLKSVRPLAFSRDGLRVLLELDHRKLFWYNPKNTEVTYIKISGMPSFNEGIICLGSLVPPTFQSKNDRKQQKLGKENTRKKRDDFLSRGFKLTL